MSYDQGKDFYLQRSVSDRLQGAKNHKQRDADWLLPRLFSEFGRDKFTADEVKKAFAQMGGPKPSGGASWNINHVAAMKLMVELNFLEVNDGMFMLTDLGAIETARLESIDLDDDILEEDSFD